MAGYPVLIFRPREVYGQDGAETGGEGEAEAGKDGQREAAGEGEDVLRGELVSGAEDVTQTFDVLLVDA